MIWDAETAELVSKKNLPKGGRLVTACAICAEDKLAVAVDASEEVFAHLFEIQGGSKPIAKVQIGMKVVHMAFNPHDSNEFATAGKDHLMICNFSNGKIKAKRGKGGKRAKLPS